VVEVKNSVHEKVYLAKVSSEKEFDLEKITLNEK